MIIIIIKIIVIFMCYFSRQHVALSLTENCVNLELDQHTVHINIA